MGSGRVYTRLSLTFFEIELKMEELRRKRIRCRWRQG